MKSSEILPFAEMVKNKEVTDCDTLDDFIKKYRKIDRYTGRNGKVWGEDYSERIDKNHQDDIEKLGYTSISQYESNTGKSEYFIPKKII